VLSPWSRGGWVNSQVFDHTSVIRFLEARFGVMEPQISPWRRAVCGDLTSAFDFKHPVFGLPKLPFITAPVGEAHGYNPIPASDVMPVQESGTKPARPLPYQPNANLTGFTTAGASTTAKLALSNSAPFAGRSAHFSVHDNTLTTTPSVAAYPAGFPGQYTVAPSTSKVETVAATGPVSPTGAYDITVIGPNRFMRRFTGDLTSAGAKVTVDAEYYHQGFQPKFVFNLVNGSSAAVNFTVTTNSYGNAKPVHYHVPAGKTTQHNIHPITTASGWYDLTVTIDTDTSWSQRFSGHVETGENSITG
jgi:phospholipase C